MFTSSEEIDLWRVPVDMVKYSLEDHHVCSLQYEFKHRKLSPRFTLCVFRWWKFNKLLLLIFFALPLPRCLLIVGSSKSNILFELLSWLSWSMSMPPIERLVFLPNHNRYIDYQRSRFIVLLTLRSRKWASCRDFEFVILSCCRRPISFVW
jgi:hypothetical protein